MLEISNFLAYNNESDTGRILTWVPIKASDGIATSVAVAAQTYKQARAATVYWNRDFAKAHPNTPVFVLGYEE